MTATERAKAWLAQARPFTVLRVVAGFPSRRRRAVLDAMRTVHRGGEIEMGPVVERAVVDAWEAGRAMGAVNGNAEGVGT